MNIAVQLEPVADSPPEVEYRWDPDTDILTANIRTALLADDTASGSVEIEGTDGSWLILDLAGGLVRGVEVAVWPDVRTRATLAPPSEAIDAVVRVPSRKRVGVEAFEMDTEVAAETDEAERTIHFRVGPQRKARSVRIARDILIDVDPRDRIAGVWLLGVPPFPGDQ